MRERSPIGEADHPGPERTCIGCRRAGAKSTLVRLVRSPDGVVRVDETGRAPGRGAYVHAAAECVRRAGRAGAIGRALRTGVDASEVGRLVAELNGRRDGPT
jgi:predicted RNA-binding protein YlxR (DUF448 family)